MRRVGAETRVTYRTPLRIVLTCRGRCAVPSSHKSLQYNQCIRERLAAAAHVVRLPVIVAEGPCPNTTPAKARTRTAALKRRIVREFPSFLKQAGEPSTAQTLIAAEGQAKFFWGKYFNFVSAVVHRMGLKSRTECGRCRDRWIFSADAPQHHLRHPGIEAFICPSLHGQTPINRGRFEVESSRRAMSPAGYLAYDDRNRREPWVVKRRPKRTHKIGIGIIHFADRRRLRRFPPRPFRPSWLPTIVPFLRVLFSYLWSRLTRTPRSSTCPCIASKT